MCIKLCGRVYKSLSYLCWEHMTPSYWLRTANTDALPVSVIGTEGESYHRTGVPKCTWYDGSWVPGAPGCTGSAAPGWARLPQWTAEPRRKRGDHENPGVEPGRQAGVQSLESRGPRPMPRLHGSGALRKEPATPPESQPPWQDTQGPGRPACRRGRVQWTVLLRGQEKVGSHSQQGVLF